MTPGARLQAAIEVLAAIDGSRLPADAVLESYFRSRRYAGSKDRRAVAERVYAVLRRRGRLDWHLERLGLAADARNRTLLAAAAEGESLADLCAGPHAPEPPDPVLSGGASLDHPDLPESLALECPLWLEPALREAFGDAFPAAMAALNRPAPVDLRVNLLKANRDTARAALAAEGVETQPTPFSPWGLRLSEPKRLGALAAFKDGLVEVQDEGSQLLALLVGAEPGMTVIDYCAGGGGKTLALGAAMGNRGRLIACDSDGPRLARLEERRRRAGLKIVESRIPDGTESWLADRLLLDVPCSGTGTWRRAPESRWRLDRAELNRLTATQRDILEATAGFVRPGGGRLAYATCSLLREENEAQIEAFLARHPEYEVQPVAVEGLPVSGPYLRLAPHLTATDGFFLALLVRR